MKAAQGEQRNSVKQAKEARSAGKIQFLTVLGANISTLLVFGITFTSMGFLIYFVTLLVGYTGDLNAAATNVSYATDILSIIVCVDSICNDFCTHSLAVWVDDDSLAVAKRIQEKNTPAASAADDPQSPSVAP